MNEHIVIITGPAPLAEQVAGQIPDEAILLAVDGGLDAALAAGLRPSGLIGDLDSVSSDGLAWAEAHATIARHPADKDATDTELALAFAADMNPARVTMIGGGDRLDHGLAAIGALGAPPLTNVPVLDAWWEGQHLDVLHGPDRRTLSLAPGSIVSLLALHGPVGKVSIDGVRWPLDQNDLPALVGLGVSNEVLDHPELNDDDNSHESDDAGAAGDVRVEVSSGVLTIFDVPASTDPPFDPRQHTSDPPTESTPQEST
ncbi:MAG: thiamine diphosphokinase [Actinomycetota bacterium]